MVIATTDVSTAAALPGPRAGSWFAFPAHC